MAKKWLGLIVVVLLLLIQFSCKKKTSEVEAPKYIAKVSDFEVPLKKVAAAFEYSKEFRKADTITADLIKSYVKHYFLDWLYLVAEAQSQGLDKDPQFIKTLKKLKIKEMTKNNGPLYRNIVPKSFDIDDKEIEQLYAYLPYRLTLQQILVTSKDLADSLYWLLRNGAKFEDLVKEYSNDLYTAGKQGVLSTYITAGMADVNFEKAAFALKQKGDFSKPVKTDFGYHIIRLIAREKLKVGSLDEERDRLKQVAELRAQNRFIKQYIDGLFYKFHFKLNRKLFPTVLQAFERQGIFGKINEDKIAPALMDSVFIIHDKDSWTLADFVEAYNKQLRYDRYRLERPEDIVIMARKLIAPELMYYDALERGLDKDPKYQAFVKYHYRHELEKMAQERLINAAVEVTDQEVKNYFKRNRKLWKNDKFDKVKIYVRNRLILEKRKQIRRDLLESLREKYPVQFNEEAVDYLVNVFQKKKNEKKS